MTHHTHPLHTPRFLKHLAAGGSLLLLLACSGGGGDSPEPAAPPASSPTAPPPAASTPTPVSYTISTHVSGAGTISPSSVSVASGGSSTFTARAASGYQLDGVSGCGGSLSGSTYTTGAVTAACTVTAVFSAVPVASSGDPLLHFSDLISGPSTGLGDGRRSGDLASSGVIVTVWGQNLGDTQGSNSIAFCDSANTCRPGYVYYWKRANGQGDSGPANLYESHGMQEIAFSIPAGSAMGAGSIRVTVGSDTSSLPFTVRAGRILHIKTTGDDTIGTGSFDQPWLTVARADQSGTAQVGDTVYIHGVVTGSAETNRAIYNNSGIQATEANHYAYVSYPGTRALVLARVAGFWPYRTTGLVGSKLTVQSSNCAADASDCFWLDGNHLSSGMTPSTYGRLIGNEITDLDGRCANGQQGAMSGGVDNLSGAKMFGNFIHDYSCREASKFHHTTYFSVRDVPNGANDTEENNGITYNRTIDAYELGWNYLKDNQAKNGLHTFDEDLSSTTHDQCGDVRGDLRIHDNVVFNQAGAGIEYVINCGWTNDAYFYNNVLINVGLPSDITCTANCGPLGSGMYIGGGGQSGRIYIFNNTVHTWDAEHMPGVSNACITPYGRGERALETIYFNDNACVTPYDKPFFSLGYMSEDMRDNIQGSGDVFYFSGAGTPTLALPPAWASSPILTNPRLTLDGPRISVGAGSPLINQSRTTLPRDIYGQRRGATSNVGAVQ